MESARREGSRVRKDRTVRVIKVDIDIPFDCFIRYLWNWYDKAVRVIAKELFNINVIDVVCRESSSARTHCWIHLKEPVDELVALILSFFFYDDHHRFNWNHSRYNSFGKTYSVLFEHKKKVSKETDNESDRPFA